MLDSEIQELNKRFSDAAAQEVLSYFIKNYPGKIAFSSSMGAEDQVITEMIVNIDKNVKIFTLDTGRLFSETYDIIERTNSRYGITIQVYFPNNEEVERMVNEKGINLFYQSIENRKMCCHIRKIQPLKRALEGNDFWISGLRRQQSTTRKENQLIERDQTNGLVKINPLINWNTKEVWDYIKEHHIPYHKLHDNGFPTIGCKPCTRAVEPGEDLRAGRWWWENPEMKECGLHNQE